MTKDVLLHEVLRKIHSGVTSFEPVSASPDDIKNFQSLAKTVVYAHSQGYIDHMIPHRDFTSVNGIMLLSW